VANANTTGFKANMVRFCDMVDGYVSTQASDTDRAGAGSAILGVGTDFAQGSMINTSTWSDLAISGDGFFNVQNLDAAGNLTGPVYQTRDGSFHLDKNGYLVNNLGYAVLDATGTGAIRVEPTPANPTYTNYRVDADGNIWGTPTTADPVTGFAPVIRGQIGLTTFPNPEGLIRMGSNLYSQGPEAGTAVTAAPNSGPRGFILDLTLENSNVDLATEMVNMIIYQADYNANSKSITVASQMLETMVNLIR
jgi:flagellar hook protein FlgE